MAAPVVVDLLDLHQAVCDTITAAVPVRAYPAYRDNPEPPCLMVVGSPVDYIELEQTFRLGMVKINVTVLLLAIAGDSQRGQEQIMAWLSPGNVDSVVSALHADRTLGGFLPANGVKFAGTRYASAVEWPAGSNTRYALGEIDLTITFGA